LATTGTDSQRTAQKTVRLGASKFTVFIRRYENDKVKENVRSTVKHLPSGYTLMGVAVVSLQHADLQNDAKKIY
jgi:hypothetical protein